MLNNQLVMLKHYNGRESLRRYCEKVIDKVDKPYSYRIGEWTYTIVDNDHLEVSLTDIQEIELKVDIKQLSWLVLLADRIENQ